MKTNLLFIALLLSACGPSIDPGKRDDSAAVDAAASCPDGPTTGCGAECVNESSDPNNCGGCGIACGASSLCCAGRCAETTSCNLTIQSLGSGSGWQNGGDWLRVFGSGFQPGPQSAMKAWIGDGRAPVRALDGSRAILQTPPGPVGAQDIKLTVGKDTVILRKAFNYSSAGLLTPWQQKPLGQVRGEDPGLAVMQDGRVLVAGGTLVPDSYKDASASAEIYTRDTDKVAPAANAMSAARWHDGAITLLDGRVLVVGGVCKLDLTGCNGDPRLADLFDPATNAFTPTATPLHIGRVYVRAMLLVDGRVLIASGNDPSIEIYDPTTDRFTLVPHAQPHVFGFIVRLRDGRVLIGGGEASTTAAEVFDADTNTFTMVGPLSHARSMLTAHTLPDGRVLVIGGSDVLAAGIHAPLDTLEAFDPVKNLFAPLPYKLTTPRTWHASALVRDGTILVMGGYTVDDKCDSLTDSVDQIDPVLGKVTRFAKLPNKNTEWTAVTLLDGSVLGVGGGACGANTALPDIDFLPGNPG